MNHQHNLIKIHTEYLSDESEKITRWCDICGAIVIDEEFDGRLNPGKYMSLKIPKLHGDLE